MDTTLWTSITPTQSPSSRRFRTLWIWLSFETCKRSSVSRPPAGGVGGSVRTDGWRNAKLTLIFFYAEETWLAVGTIYSRDLCRLDPAGGARPRRDVDQNVTAASTSPQKANTVVYIFFYKRKLKIWPALKQIITVVPVHHLFLYSFSFFSSCFCVCDNFSFTTCLFLIVFFLGCWNHFLVCRVWRCVEDNVMCFSCGDESRSRRHLVYRERFLSLISLLFLCSFSFLLQKEKKNNGKVCCFHSLSSVTTFHKSPHSTCCPSISANHTQPELWARSLPKKST